jgi:phage baseplate assembly protein gpV
MAKTALNATPVVKIRGAAIKDEYVQRLADARFSDELGASASATLRFADPLFELFSGNFAKINDSVEFSIADETGKKVQLFRGVIVGVAIDQGFSEGHQLVINAYDQSNKLSRLESPKAHLNVSPAELIRKIAKRNGLTAKVSIPTVQLDYFMEIDDDQTTLDFLAARLGFEWWVEDKKLVVQPPKLQSAIKLTWRESLTNFSARYSGAARVDSVTVRGWDPDTQKPVSGVAKRSALSGRSIGADVPLYSARAKQSKALGGNAVVTDSPVANAKEAKVMAEALQGDIAANELMVTGDCVGEPGLGVGKSVKIEGLGPQLSGSFFLTRVEHRYSSETTLVTKFEAGRGNSFSLGERLASTQRKVDRSLRQFALGTVTNIKDPEKSGRVRVKVPSLSQADESNWARVVAPGAGADRGLQLPYEVGDEVMVAYLGGDPRFPVVVGGVWSKKHKPPVPDVAPKDKVGQRTLRFGSGSQIAVIDDDKGKAACLRLEHQDKTTFISLGEDGIEMESQSKGKIVIKVGKASLELDGKGTITLKGTDIKLSASKELSLQGQKVSLKGKTAALVDGGGSKADLKPSGAKIQSSGITEIKGSMLKLN